MTAIRLPTLTLNEIQELENALAVAKVACTFIKRKFPYGSDVSDAADDVIKACNTMEDEAYSAPRCREG